MNATTTTVPSTISIRVSRLAGLVFAVAAVAIVGTWAVTTGNGSGQARKSVQPSVLGSLTQVERQHVQSIVSLSHPQLVAAFGTGTVNALDALGLTPKEERYVLAITSMTPAQLEAAFGTGNASSVLPDLTPSERQHVESIVSLSPAQLKAAFGTGGVLSTLTPAEQQHVEAIVSLSPAQLKAAFGTGGAVSTQPYQPAISSVNLAQAKATLDGGVLSRLTPAERGYVEGITSASPAELKAAFGTGR